MGEHPTSQIGDGTWDDVRALMLSEIGNCPADLKLKIHASMEPKWLYASARLYFEDRDLQSSEVKARKTLEMKNVDLSTHPLMQRLLQLLLLDLLFYPLQLLELLHK